MGAMCPPYYGKSKYYYKKKQRAIKQIEKQQEVVKICDEKIAKQEKENQS